MRQPADYRKALSDTQRLRAAAPTCPLCGCSGSPGFTSFACDDIACVNAGPNAKQQGPDIGTLAWARWMYGKGLNGPGWQQRYVFHGNAGATLWAAANPMDKTYDNMFTPQEWRYHV